jgi:hypothetical protein
MASRNKPFTGLVIVFVAVSIVAFLLKGQLGNIQADYLVILGANTLLFVFGVISLLLHTNALAKPNPQAFIRSVLLANVLKILGLATAAFIYISVAGKSTSTNAVFGGLLLYIIYTWVEKRATIQLSKSRND